MNFDELKWEIIAKVKTINWKQPALILFIVFAAMIAALELLAPIAEARWGVRWGGAGGWNRWGGWGGSSWGGWGRPWYSGWGGWW